MPVTTPRDSIIGVIGDGFGSLMVYSTAIYLGFRPEQVTIFGPSDSPANTYQQFAHNLGQTVLRSESESHFLPADWPTFAELEAWSRFSPAPLWRSIERKYNPGVPDILSQVLVVARRLGWNDNRSPKRIGWVQREYEPMPHFVLYDEDANYAGRAKHVMLATGHGQLTYPPLLAKARTDPVIAERIVQAYEAKSYAPGGRYICVGAGIAAINEWANALDVGASMLSLLRRPEPEEQDLNAPRCFFESLGIDAFAELSFDERLAFLSKVLKGTAPKRRNWAAKIRAGREQGRFDQVLGEIDAVEPGPAGLRVHIRPRSGPDVGSLDVTGIVCATGFSKSVLTIPLLRRLVEFYDLPVEEGKMLLRNNCGVAKLDQPDSRLCMMGLNASTVIPHGDTIAGLKFIGRRFVADVARAEAVKPPNFFKHLRLQVSLARESAKAIRRVPRAEQLA